MATQSDTNGPQDPGPEPAAASAATSQPASATSSSVGAGSQTAKSVYIFRNGDLFAPSKKFVLNRRQLRDWDNFLEQVTLSVNPLRGAVRAIVTPKRGRRRVQDLDSFDDKAYYVALAKGERFKPMAYVPEGDLAAGSNEGGRGSPNASPRKPVGGNRVVLQPILPVVHNKKFMSVQPRFNAKMEVISSQSKAIRVYRNGDEFTPAIITMLRPAEQVSMEVVLRAIEERVVLPNNMAIRKLYDLNGRRIREPKELQHEKFYVAGGHEAFLPRPYGQKLPVIIMGKAERVDANSWASIKYLSQPITPEKHSSRKSKAEQQEQQEQQQQQKSQKPPPQATAADKEGTRRQQKAPASQADKAKAASQIQASVKGFETRKAAAEKQTGGPVTIKPDAANSKANIAKANNNDNNKSAKAKPTKEEQEKSATAIQASVRGFETRKAAAEKQTKKPIDIKNEPANSKQTKQQQQTTKKNPMTEEERAAAKSIQASVNSYKTRKAVAKQEAGRTRL